MGIMANMGIVPKMAKSEIKEIDVDKLVENPDNFFHIDDMNMETLKNSIAAFGIQQNLVVTPTEGGKYMIVAGHRRCRAVKELLKENAIGVKRTVPCRIEYDEMAANMLLIMTNLESRELTNYEKIESYQRMDSLVTYYLKTGKLQGHKRDLMAKRMHMSETGIGRMNVIAKKLLDDFTDYIKDGKIGMSVAYEIARKPANEQQAFAYYLNHEREGNSQIKMMEAMQWFNHWEWENEENNEESGNDFEERAEEPEEKQPEIVPVKDGTSRISEEPIVNEENNAEKNEESGQRGKNERAEEFRNAAYAVIRLISYFYDGTITQEDMEIRSKKIFEEI